MSNDKTLATAKHGGCVQLGNGLPPLPASSAQCLTTGEPLFSVAKMKLYARAALSAQPSPGGQGDALGCIGRIEEAIEFRVPHDVYAAVHGELSELKAALAARQPVGEPVSDECEGCKGGIRYDAQGCSCMTCGKRPKWYMAGRRIRVTERRKPWKHLGAPVPFEAECTWQMGDSIDYRLDGETTSRRLNNFHQHWEKVEVIR